MNQTKLVLLNGFSGCGKSTIANRYIEDHPLSMNLEGDRLIVMLGKWRENWNEAAQIKIALSKIITAAHLRSGHDVIIPFLLTNSEDATEFQQIAEAVGASFFEIMLHVKKEEAIARLLKRGRWGEDGSATFTPDEYPKIDRLYDRMEEATAMRECVTRLYPKEDDVEGTYQDFLKAINVTR